MRLLIAEDHTYLASSLRIDLERDHGWTVDIAHDPTDAARRLHDNPVDVVVVDLQFDARLDAIDAEPAPATWADVRWIRSGLSVVAAAQSLGADAPGVALFTAGDAVRRLHLTYARQELGVGVFCSKNSGIAELTTAIRASAARYPYTDPELRARMPMPTTSGRIGTTLLGSPRHAQIWVALALGMTSPPAIARFVGSRKGTVNNDLSAMIDALTEFDPGQDTGRKRQAALVRYAELNRAFFLDAAVRDHHDH